MTPEDSIAIIDKAIAGFKINYRESSVTFLLWGWILSLASFSNFIILRILHIREAYNLMGKYSFLNWLVFGVIGFILMFILARKIDRKKKVYSQMDTYVRKLWIATAASFFVAIVICMKLEIAPPPVMLLIAGLATTTTGLLIRFRPMTIGGMSFFVFAIAAAFLNNEYIALVTGAAILCGYLIPGYFLRAAK